jgi:hypothetical protein
MDLLAAHLRRQGGIVLNARADTHDEGLLAHTAHYFFRIVSLFLKTAGNRLIADGPERCARGTLREIPGELFRRIRHHGNRDPQLVERRSFLSGKFTNPVAVRDGFDVPGYRAT